jgi:membrane protease YdiL (CAAX protease family)
MKGRRPGTGAGSAPRITWRFSAADAVPGVLYLLLAGLFVLLPPTQVPGLDRLLPDPVGRTYLLNLGTYAVLAACAGYAAWTFVVPCVRVLARRPFFTAAMAVLAIVAMLLLTAVLAAMAGPLQPTVNQQGLEALMKSVPAWLMIPVVVLLGPFVEEYIFRHLLIGKLSRHVNVWLCCALSALLFAAVHVLGKEGLTLPALLPYLAMGVTLVGAYLLSGRNLMFSYLVHAGKNLLAVVLIYTLPVELLSP